MPFIQTYDAEGFEAAMLNSDSIVSVFVKHRTSLDGAPTVEASISTTFDGPTYILAFATSDAQGQTMAGRLIAELGERVVDVAALATTSVG